MQTVISLGENCEVSFQIEKYLGKIDASLFSWAEVNICALLTAMIG